MVRKATPVEQLDDGLMLTQFGEGDDPFPNRLRIDRQEVDMSLTMGPQEPLAVSLLVTKTPMPWAKVRHGSVGSLRKQGFRVVHSPSTTNPLHVSVLPPMGSDGPLEWDEDMAKKFDQCFTMAMGGEIHEQRSPADGDQLGVGTNARR